MGWFISFPLRLLLSASPPFPVFSNFSATGSGVILVLLVRLRRFSSVLQFTGSNSLGSGENLPDHVFLTSAQASINFNLG